MSRRARLRLAALVGVAVLAAAVWALRAGDREQGGWVEVRRGDLVVNVEVSGTLRAVEFSQLGPPQIRDHWNFKISQMAPEGEHIEAGELALAFDSSELTQLLRTQMAERDSAQKEIEKTGKELELEQRNDRLRLEEARARCRKARLEVEVPEEILEGNDLAKARLDLELAEREIAYLERRLEAAERASRAALAALQATRDTADQKVRELKDAIEAMSVRAPRAGTVIYVTDWRDDKKKVGDSCWRGEEVIELPDLSRMMAKGEVDEADAGRVAEGQRVRLTLDAHPDVHFAGRVESIWRTVQRQSWRTPQKVVRMDISLDETDVRRMRPGMRFRGEVEVERAEAVLTVPLETVFTTSEGPVVWRETLLGAQRVVVRLGRRNATHVEVLDGLSEGDRVSTRSFEPEEQA